jgi:hypothetical protein
MSDRGGHACDGCEIAANGHVHLTVTEHLRYVVGVCFWRVPVFRHRATFLARDLNVFDKQLTLLKKQCATEGDAFSP